MGEISWDEATEVLSDAHDRYREIARIIALRLEAQGFVIVSKNSLYED